MKTIIPPRLRSGDLIGVVSPASPPHDTSRLARGITYLLQRGFRVRLGTGVGLRNGYFAGPDRVRRMDLVEMFEDEQVRAIFCTRGGYGSARLLEGLDWSLIRHHPKIFVGFSDITALSMGMYAKSGLVTFAGPMVAAEFADEMSFAVETALWESLMKPKSENRLQIGDGTQTIRAGSAEGVLIGGNLSVFCSLIGTPFMPDFSDAILFFEDVGEDVYRIDRLFLQLKYAGILQKAAGIVLGSFTSVPEARQNRPLDEVFEEYLLPLNIPILAGFPFGHIREKLTLPFGAIVRVNAGKGKLVVLQPVVT